MKLLVVGANSTYAIERFYLKNWKENSLGNEIEFFASQNLFYEYYNKNIFNKIFYKLGISSIYKKINQLLKERINLFAPEIIFVFKGMELFPMTLDYAKKRGIKLVNYNPDNPFIFSGSGSGNSNITKSIGLYDFHFTYSEDIKRQFDLQFNIPTAILPFGFDIEDAIFKKAKNSEEINRVCFIGNPDIFRAKLINNLAKKSIEIDVYGHNWEYFIKHKNIKCFNTVSDKELWYTLRKYRIQLNIMRPHNLDSHNMRTFEVPGIGGIQLAPDTKEHRFFFEVDKEIFLYNTIAECVTKINYLLSLTTEQVNQYRTYAREACIKNKHSYKDRAQQVMELLKKL